MSADQVSLFQYLLRQGDNCLILSHRLSQWVGHAPAIEEELALANVALDLLGQATLWLDMAGEVEGKGRDANKLTYLRDVSEFRNVLLVEQPNGGFALTMARQMFFDTWHHLVLAELSRSADSRIAAIAAKALPEVTYHLERSHNWVLRLGDGTEESHRRMQAAIDDLWMYTGELFEMDEIDQALLEEGIAVDLDTLRSFWFKQVLETLDEGTLQKPASDWAQRGGKSGRHSEHLGYLLAELQFLQRAYPNATW